MVGLPDDNVFSGLWCVEAKGSEWGAVCYDSHDPTGFYAFGPGPADEMRAAAEAEAGQPLFWLHASAPIDLRDSAFAERAGWKVA